LRQVSLDRTAKTRQLLRLKEYQASLPSSIFSICQQFLALSAIFSCFSLDRTRQLLKLAENAENG
jgi:hypothetical protein